MGVFLGGGVPLVGPGRTAGRATLPEWIWSQGVYFEPREGGEVRIFGVYTNKQTNKGNELNLTMPQNKPSPYCACFLKIWGHHPLDLCTYCVCFPKNRMTTRLQFPRLWYERPYVLSLVFKLHCCQEAAFSNYQIVHGLPPPPFSHPDSLECWYLRHETALTLECWRLGGSDVGDLGMLFKFGGWGCDLYKSCVNLGMRANPSTCRVLILGGTKSASGQWCTFGRTAGRAGARQVEGL